MMDLSELYYSDWKDRGTRNFGMRRKQDDLRHGVLRILTKDSMEEASWKKGKRHGFSRQISATGVVVQILLEGEEIARTYLNNSLERFALRGK